MLSRADVGVMRKLITHTVTAMLLTVVWAICFRPQIEKGRVSLLSLFALVTIQAVGAWFARFMGLL